MAEAKSTAKPSKSEERALSLFSTERMEDYAAIVLAALLILLVAVWPVSSVKTGDVNVNMDYVNSIQSDIDNGKNLDYADPVKVAAIEAAKYNLKYKYNPDDPKKSDISLFVPPGQDPAAIKASGVAVVVVKHHFATQASEYGLLMTQPGKKGEGGAWTIAKVGGKKGITTEYSQKQQ